MADVVSEGKESRVQEAVQNNTKNLEDVFRANERASASLEIMQIVLAGSLAFDIIDRLHGLYLGVAADIDWANNAFGFIYETPGMLLLVNMAWWGVLGAFIQGLIKHMGEQAAVNLKPETRNPKPETRNPRPGTRNPKPETRNPESGAPYNLIHLLNPLPVTLYPLPVDHYPPPCTVHPTC